MSTQICQLEIGFEITVAFPKRGTSTWKTPLTWQEQKSVTCMVVVKKPMVRQQWKPEEQSQCGQSSLTVMVLKSTIPITVSQQPSATIAATTFTNRVQRSLSRERVSARQPIGLTPNGTKVSSCERVELEMWLIATVKTRKQERIAIPSILQLWESVAEITP